MIADELSFRIRERFNHVPTAEQATAISIVADFLADRDERTVMILRGSAGTGKTTLAAALVQALVGLKQKLVLMAPTGRAAKVFSLYANLAAFTIHRRIYRQRVAGDLRAAFNLNNNLQRDTLFIVDEASMIAAAGDTSFGSGSLLADLIHFVYSGDNCHLMLIGDHAQLPPVGEDESPALSADVLSGLRLRVYEATLNEVLRQSHESGILLNATTIRHMIAGQEGSVLPRIRCRGFADISVVTGSELIEALSSSYSHVGIDDTIVITRSNKRANIYNQGIRNQILDREEELCRGDQLMIVKNNYYWTMQAEGSPTTPSTPQPQGGGGSFLANGDRCVVQRVRNIRQLYGFRFADVSITLPDYDDKDLTVTVLLSTLTAEAPALTRAQQEALYQQVMEDYADLPLKGDRLRALRSDAHFNALQVKYGYAVTCHKAQGGQWSHVYIDQGYITDEMLSSTSPDGQKAANDYLRWLYTALTRATEKVYLVNWPEQQTE